MSKPKLSAVKKKELAWVRKSLFPKGENALPEPIDDPMGAAWAWEGIDWTYKLYNGTTCTYKIWNGAQIKLRLLAVAKLNVEGIPATPKNVCELMKVNTYKTVASRLRWLATGSEWWSEEARERMVDKFPLRRVRYGRTHAYFINEPS